MAPGRDDDLDWLYGREPKGLSEPERTRVMPLDPRDLSSQAPAPDQTAPQATARQNPPAWDREPQPQPGYPGRPTYGRPVDGPPVRNPPGSPPPGPTVPSGARRRRPRRPARVVRRLLGLLLLVVIAFLVGVPVYAWNQVQRVDDAPSGARPADQPGTTFLLVGSDSRQGLSTAERKKLGTGNTAGQRTDTIMILSIPPGGKPALISVPRDSYLPIPKHGRNKINAAYGLGGPQLLVKTIEQNTGLRMDGYLEIGFGGFVNVIDAEGGIEMCLPKAIKDRDSHINLPKGCQTLNGTDALGYVRMRKADPRGDLGRVERQRAMLAAVAKKGVSASTIANPMRYWNLSNATAGSIRLGQQTSFLSMLRLARAMQQVAGGKGLTLTVPVSNPGASTPVGSSVLWDQKAAAAMFADVARGDTSKLEKYAK